MPFAEDFAHVLQNAGINLKSWDVPSLKEVAAGLSSLEDWLQSLEPDTREAVDGVTAGFKVKLGLADPNVNIAPGLFFILSAADASPVTLDITSVLSICRDAVKQASGGRV